MCKVTWFIGFHKYRLFFLFHSQALLPKTRKWNGASKSYWLIDQRLEEANLKRLADALHQAWIAFRIERIEYQAKIASIPGPSKRICWYWKTQESIESIRDLNRPVPASLRPTKFNSSNNLKISEVAGIKNQWRFKILISVEH